MGDRFRLFADDAGDLLENVDEGGSAVAGGLGEVGAAPDRLAVRRQEHGERPAALLAESMEGAHVDLVDVRPFFAIDLDIDEQAVHDGRRLGILEAFVGHDMAPVAGGIADGEQDRLVGAAGLLQRGGAPRAPVDRIVLVLKQVGARLCGELVFGHGTQSRGILGV